MPLYDYRCEHCGVVFEVLRRADARHERLTCPQCGGGRVVRVFGGTFMSGPPHGRGAFDPGVFERPRPSRDRSDG